ncbi:DUF2264 domain-containing protein [Microbacterium sp. M3]|uniref:DUF2264 domain-containing protein n=1 Tax=Microbacterium arthrosphaerae TaxID=792652 RepID=A0ABU4H4C3_9MICO|nr:MULTISPECIES: DUF2264 domain-containing protein [Microbacterium]MDW4574166.1 DUF2264 domain-containing protein [Microbacterium arthrosphaerae]MDW7608021.1 DUF2264 domain-containing protein [Microbacterium sp. M3]
MTVLQPRSPQRVSAPSAATRFDWSRDEWLAYADRLLDTARIFASPGHGRIHFPGAEGGYGHAVDGLEGFARTFLLAGFRIAGARGEGTGELADFYRQGIVTGVDPDADDRWVRLDEHAQAKVEAASLALVLDMTRPWIWDRLDEVTQQRVIAYLAPVVGDSTYPKTNWLWFRVVVQTFLRSVGGPWSADDIADDLALHDELVRDDGWISDGFERSYDHYVGWALHTYPVLWSRMQGAGELAGGRTPADIVRLDRFLQDAVALIGGDGSPLIQGRSLIYRFAAAAPFWIGAMAEVPSVPLGQLRRAANAVVAHFADAAVPGEDGVLTMGWHHEWRELAQSYSGPGSPYWAVKGLLGVALPADHPVWAAQSTPLPIESGDELRTVRPAGWVISGTQADGIVRIVNHGTDHAADGSLVGDSPLYARIGYATAAGPLANQRAWEEPLEQSVALVDAAGRATHRAAMDLIDVRVQDDEGGRVGIAASVSRAHWIDIRPTAHRHGSGIEGEIEVAGAVEVHSLVRGPWEVRLVRVDSLEPGVDAASLSLRVGGWALAADEAPRSPNEGLRPNEGRITVSGPSPRRTPSSQDTENRADAAASVFADALSSGIRPLLGAGAASVETREDASPLGPLAAVPVITFPVEPGAWTATLVELTSAELASPGDAAVALEADGDQTTVTVTWPDGTATTSRLAHPGTASVANR